MKSCNFFDNLAGGGLQMVQGEKGYRYSLDPILLARFVSLKRGARVVDLGSGCGILPLLLATLSDADHFIGIERQPSLAELAQENVKRNGLSGRVTILHGDIRNIEPLVPVESVDVVVSNPPYRRPQTGRIAPNDERAAARHELAGGLPEFVAAAKWVLKNGGIFALVYLVERLPELMTTLTAAGIEPKRLRMIHSRSGERAKLLLLEGHKGGRPGLTVEPPLFIYRDDGDGRCYTDEVLEMYEAGSC